MKIKKQVLITVMILVAVAGFFWTQSRYPALFDHAAQASTEATQGLSFGVIMETEPDDPFYWRVYCSTVNWINTNKKGMSFGVIFGAILLTLLFFLPRAKGNNRFLNALKGVIMGIPLGVCANCATPIAKGMFDAGEKVETAVTTMMSSPTMNIVVLTILFSLFPFPVAATKVTATLLVLLVIVPVLSRYWKANPQALASEEELHQSGQCSYMAQPVATDKTWAEAAKETFGKLLKNLWYLTKVTVPLMLLAGFLGAFMVELIPFERFVDFSSSWPVMFGAAAFGAFLPVPMSFDVIVASSLYTAGMSQALTMVLLFTMGIFSVYPFLVFWKMISKKTAVTMAMVVIIMGVIAGYAVEYAGPATQQLASLISAL